MASALNMKFKAIQKKIDQSAKARPWKRPVVFIVALAWILLLAIFEMLKSFFKEEDKDTPPVEEYLDRFGRKPSELFYGWYANDATVFSDMQQQEEEKNSYN